MKVLERPSLRGLNTFGVDAMAALRIDIETEEDVLALPSFDPAHDLLLGGGSNVLLVSDVPGTIFLNCITGREVIGQEDGRVIVEVGAGEVWHDFVTWCVDQNLSGVENLSLIPGRAGAAPIQNIGAYGVELSSALISVTAWDLHKQAWRVFSREECRFEYRDSRFKSSEPDRYLITSLRLAVNHEFKPRIDYPGLLQELESNSDSPLTPRRVAAAVNRIRRRKLPDPAKVGNAGSFFKNPVLKESNVSALVKEYPELPTWPAGPERTKISAAWLIERCGLKGVSEGGATVSQQHALVLTNSGDCTGEEIWRLARRVRERVERQFGILLEPEPRIVDFREKP